MPHTFGITDIVSYQRQDSPSFPAVTQTVRISGFFKIETVRPQSSILTLLDLDLGHVRRLVPCALDDLDFSVVACSGLCSGFYNPLDLTWEKPVLWSAEHVAEVRATHARRVEEGWDFAHGLSSSNGYNDLLGRHADLTEHARLRIRAWVADCRAKAAAWEGIPA